MILWGTGNVCNHLLQSNPDLNPEYFIDNSMEKANSYWNNRKILHPSQVKAWEGVFVVVALDNYVPVKAQLEEKGLTEGKEFLWYRDFLFQKTLPELEREAESCCGLLKRQATFYRGKSIIVSDFLAFDKGVCTYINNWNKNGLDAVLLSEAYWISDAYAETKMEIPVVKLPAILAHNQYLKTTRLPVEKEKIEYVQRKDYLDEARQNLRMGYPKMAVNYEYVVCYWADKIMNIVLEHWQPKEVILWNAFYAFHKIIREICAEKKIPVKYMEFGNIPGTIQVESIGQMGESYPARFPEEFLKIEVSKKELQDAEKLIEELCRNRVNRNIQPQNNLLENVKKKLVQNRPVVFYAGQNDNAAGMQPYTENSRKYHSPIFESSDAAAVYLAKLCAENEWNFIYKPHPMMMGAFVREQIPENVMVVDNVDINDLIDMADVVVTILSTVSYNALIRNKPVVMLGYTQLKGKGCTYEAFEKEYIIEQIKESLLGNEGKAMYSNYVLHIAQLQKYYFVEKHKDVIKK